MTVVQIRGPDLGSSNFPAAKLQIFHCNSKNSFLANKAEFPFLPDDP